MICAINIKKSLFLKRAKMSHFSLIMRIFFLAFKILFLNDLTKNLRIIFMEKYFMKLTKLRITFPERILSKFVDCLTDQKFHQVLLKRNESRCHKEFCYF